MPLFWLTTGTPSQANIFKLDIHVICLMSREIPRNRHEAIEKEEPKFIGIERAVIDIAMVSISLLGLIANCLTNR
jgi:hypothetical protein